MSRPPNVQIDAESDASDPYCVGIRRAYYADDVILDVAAYESKEEDTFDNDTRVRVCLTADDLFSALVACGLLKQTGLSTFERRTHSYSPTVVKPKKKR